MRWKVFLFDLDIWKMWVRFVSFFYREAGCLVIAQREVEEEIGTISRLGADCIGLRWFVYSCGDNYFQSRAGRATSLRYRLARNEFRPFSLLPRFLFSQNRHTHTHKKEYYIRTAVTFWCLISLTALLIIYFLFIFTWDEEWERLEEEVVEKSGTLSLSLCLATRYTNESAGQGIGQAQAPVPTHRGTPSGQSRLKLIKTGHDK
jgi:hypothetical protein